MPFAIWGTVASSETWTRETLGVTPGGSTDRGSPPATRAASAGSDRMETGSTPEYSRRKTGRREPMTTSAASPREPTGRETIG